MRVRVHDLSVSTQQLLDVRKAGHVTHDTRRYVPRREPLSGSDPAPLDLARHVDHFFEFPNELTSPLLVYPPSPSDVATSTSNKAVAITIAIALNFRTVSVDVAIAAAVQHRPRGVVAVDTIHNAGTASFDSATSFLCRPPATPLEHRESELHSNMFRRPEMRPVDGKTLDSVQVAPNEARELCWD